MQRRSEETQTHHFLNLKMMTDRVHAISLSKHIVRLFKFHGLRHMPFLVKLKAEQIQSLFEDVADSV
jgi:uncharacterized protein YqhQ